MTFNLQHMYHATFIFLWYFYFEEFVHQRLSLIFYILNIRWISLSIFSLIIYFLFILITIHSTPIVLFYSFINYQQIQKKNQSLYNFTKCSVFLFSRNHLNSFLFCCFIIILSFHLLFIHHILLHISLWFVLFCFIFFQRILVLFISKLNNINLIIFYSVHIH